MADDRERWNDRYRDGHEGATPLLLGRSLHLFPRSGRAIDVAGGNGQAAAILAARGMSVTVVDVSDVALEQALARAERSSLDVTAERRDLSREPLPDGPWDVITCFNYLDRRLFPAMVDQLAEGGVLALSIATMSNLQRHARPPAEFLLGDGEILTLIGDLTVVHYREGWQIDGRHCAELIARRI